MKKIIATLMILPLLLLQPLAATAVETQTHVTEEIRDRVTQITEQISAMPESEAVAAQSELFSESTVSELPTMPLLGTEVAPERIDPPTTEPQPTDPPTTEPEPTEPPPLVICFGDVNKDGKVTAGDARLILMFCAGLISMNKEQCVIADFDRNGKVSSADARKTLRTAALLESPIPFDLVVTDPDQMMTTHIQRKDYVPYLAGFSTNIRDPQVFDKIRDLENYCASQKQRITFYYTDVRGKYYIQYNSNWVFRTQCTIKAPYVKGLLVYMERNNIPMDMQLQLHGSQKWKGHYVSGFANGTWLSIRDLIYYTIRFSDNTAYQVLFDHFGPGILNESAKNAGSSLRLSGYIFGETSASDMAKLFLDIYRYNGIYRDILFDDMRNATHNDDMIGRGVPKNIDFIHKFGNGADMTTGLHDCAVIFTEIPCVLIVYTSLNSYGDFSRVQFGQVASRVIGINGSVEYY